MSDTYKKIKSSTTYTGHHNSQISFLDIPFFFNDRQGSFYRYEAFIYNYGLEHALKNNL